MNARSIAPFAAVFLTICSSSLEAVDFIRQIQLIEDQSIVYDIPISGATGDVMSKPLESDGAVFQLYAYEDETYSPWSLLDLNAGNLAHVNVSLDSHLVDLDLLGIHLDLTLGGSGDEAPLPQLVDETTVGTHLPQGTIVLRSEDPYFPPRTRADRPYSMTFAVRSLADPADPRGGVTKTVMERDFKVYHPDLHVPFPNGSGQGTYSDAYEFSKNGDFTDSTIYGALPFERPTKMVGEESFIARVPLDDDGREVNIASATIQIWPMCEATVEGIEQDKRYLGVPPEARVVFKDLYPDSVAYAQIYKGAPTLGRTGKIIGSTVISFNTYAPQNAVVPLNIDDDAITGDGTYTVEVVTVTPFNGRQPERVTYVSFELDRTIEVRGTLADSEK